MMVWAFGLGFLKDTGGNSWPGRPRIISWSGAPLTALTPQASTYQQLSWLSHQCPPNDCAVYRGCLRALVVVRSSLSAPDSAQFHSRSHSSPETVCLA